MVLDRGATGASWFKFGRALMRSDRADANEASISDPGAAGQLFLPLLDYDTFAIARPLSPKRPLAETSGLADLFPYYAGFSFDWACSKVRELSSGDSSQVVLDPWNGGGTTTQAARHDGNPAVGIDRNPVATLVAQLRCVLGKRAKAPGVPTEHSGTVARPDDPLAHWFGPTTAARIREWVNLLQESEYEARALGVISIFRAVRSLTKDFEGTNPTWVRRAKADTDRINLPNADLDELIINENSLLLDRLASDPGGSGNVALITASAHKIPLMDKSVDVILTSPPYLTRIDYAIAYARELAVLGIDVLGSRELRSSLMGTTLIRPVRTHAPTLGPLATDLLHRVSSHPSKASNGYYLKQVRQYLDDLCLSLDEISRVAKFGAALCLVVQDSFYKDEPIRLAEMCLDEGTRRGWNFESQSAFPVRHSLTTLNSSARKYEKSQVEESVITFRLGAL
jgi:hypothetical protein